MHTHINPSFIVSEQIFLPIIIKLGCFTDEKKEVVRLGEERFNEIKSNDKNEDSMQDLIQW